ncbi:hypothetical protein Ddye_011946 [Dipteronia dyeriana]|uniref:Uncharacterized protein n=1 Tax=Dipteronia dyeriana TaxID=168575 RepID=A0AAE0CHX7_9ROSI|nr:hypothetical protein Ddye_011946 [Dipteronia dyeriana]
MARPASPSPLSGQLRIVASSQFGDSFVGLYDMSSGSSGNVMFSNDLPRLVKNLECKWLLMRQPAVVRTKETRGVAGDSKNSLCFPVDINCTAAVLSAGLKLLSMWNSNPS